MKYRMVRINWVDATSMHGWKSLRDTKTLQLARISSVGYLVRETKCKYVLALSMDKSDANCAMAIPRDWVESISDLKVAK